MKIISINAGSSSLKFSLFDMENENVIASGLFERIGIEGSKYTIKFNGEKIQQEVELNNHTDAVNILLDKLTDLNIIKSLDEINGVGHRVVQGKDVFAESVLITDEVMEKLDGIKGFAPLHNPANMLGIEAFRNVLPDVPMVAVFDTAFHQTMDEENYLYALPYDWCDEYKIRKYGAHGTSHKYVSLRMNEILGRYNTKLITCHIGNGASISAVLNGRCINTSMGLTPNAGLIMGSRCGDIDATIVPYMMKKLNLTPEEMDTILNKKSGLLGISGVSSDSRDIEDGIIKGNSRCDLAQKMYVRRIIDYIAKYYVELGGCDAIVFTAGVGENSIHTRREVIDGLSVLGVKIDEEANNVRGVEQLITAPDSTIPCYIIPTNEELMIARDTYRLSVENERDL